MQEWVFQMNKIQFYPFQEQGLKDTEHFNRVAYYWDMGLGKTFVGAEKLVRLGAKTNLIVCQKSKIEDWVNHFRQYYKINIFNLTNKDEFQDFTKYYDRINAIGIVNYEITYRRPELEQLRNFTLLVDESSLIQNEQTKRTKFITRSQPQNIILLSGTPTAGRYEKLITQIHLLGWNISEKLFWNHYVDWEWVEDDGFFRKKINGYKNVDRLKTKLRQHGAIFLKSEEVFDLPKQVFIKVKVPVTKEYKKFMRDRIITINDRQLVGDTPLTKMLYARMLCGQYNRAKLETFTDLINSTDDRLIVFYNFNDELMKLMEIAHYFERPVSIINGQTKNLDNYETENNSITFIQYQAGAMGLNLQKANKVIYFTLPQSSELFEQSKKRIHRIGQDQRCFYYYLLCSGSLEEDILTNLELRRDYTDELFKKYDETY
jgi:SNF2 family DNA or RNA helicase